MTTTLITGPSSGMGTLDMFSSHAMSAADVAKAGYEGYRKNVDVVIPGWQNKTDDAWFDGVDDPNLTAIEVVPLDAHYWDAKNNRLISMAKMGIAAITGRRPDLTEQGDLNI